MHHDDPWVGEVIPQELPEPERDPSEATVAEALGASRGLLAPLFNAVPELIVVLEVEPGPEFRFLTTNRAWLHLTGLDADQVSGKLVQDVMPPGVAAFARDKCIEAIEAGHPIRYEQILRRAPGPTMFDATATPIFDDNGDCTHILWVARDITAMKQAEDDLRKKSAILRLLHAASTAANRASSIEEAARIVLHEVCAHTGWPVGHVYLVNEATGALFPSAVWYLEDPKAFADFRRVTETGRLDPSKGLAGWVMLSGEPRSIQDAGKNEHFDRAFLARRLGFKGAYAFPVLVGRKVVAVLEFYSRAPADLDDALREVMDLIGDQLSRVAERATAHRELEDTARRMRTLSLNDDLTGVNNRRGFITMANFQLKLAKRAKKRLGLLFVDLDNMKEINDEFGHLQGDLVLVDLARLLADTFRESDIVGRVGGDEFCVLLTSMVDDDVASSLSRLDDAIDVYNANGHRPHALTLSSGVAIFDPARPCKIEELIDRADAAMYVVKTEKREQGPAPAG